ncbi:hypothetical protein AaE_016251 [Aphanomyces astaci]|uniref:Uncharacterized protein n=1 Tax=Aphanomyces astaci TaxID=112090 RepID=A0A6A4YXC3_APHAT|nr:hypothetical protein AaE_016251 [Aphanomyces astaci]
MIPPHFMVPGGYLTYPPGTSHSHFGVSLSIMNEVYDATHETDLPGNEPQTPQPMNPKRSRRTPATTPKRTHLWDDDGVAALFHLRYKSHLALRFESKNNAEIYAAYVVMAAELSVSMEQDVSVAQIQDKVHMCACIWDYHIYH